MAPLVSADDVAASDVGTATRDEPLPRFIHWAAAQLQLPVVEAGGGLRIVVPENVGELFPDKVARRLATEWPANASTDDAPAITPGRQLAEQLAELLRLQGPAVHTRPRHQPNAAHQIASELLAAYQVDDGLVHLAGCSLEDRPYLRLTIARGEQGASGVRHFFVSPDGSSVSSDEVDRLGLDQLEPLQHSPQRLDEAKLKTLIAAGRRMAAQHNQQRNPDAKAQEPLAVALVWAKHAEGRFEFTIGEQSTVLPFAGWTKTLTAPAWVCPHSGAITHHLAATDDGRIVAAEEIATCAKSGRRVLRQELVKCAATARLVLPEYVATCPVLGQPVLRDEFVTCPTCRQQVGRPALEQQGCRGCQRLRPAATADPRLEALLSEYPALGQWKRWQLAETETVCIFRAAGMWRRLLIVCQRDSLEVIHLATRGRFSSKWQTVDRSQWAKFGCHRASS